MRSATQNSSIVIDGPKQIIPAILAIVLILVLAGVAVASYFNTSTTSGHAEQVGAGAVEIIDAIPAPHNVEIGQSVVDLVKAAPFTPARGA